MPSQGSGVMPGGPGWLTLALKRLLDLTGAVLALAILSPLLVALSVLVHLKVGSPVFFRQVRAGKNGRPFRLWKFRTMTSARDATGQLLPDRDRLTKLGSSLRIYSLDELPNLFNVLVGNMSLVGPRPLLMRYVPRYSDRQRLRLQVKPGLTGLAQLSGRNALDWDARLELDAQYAERISVLLDVSLLLKTAWKVVTREGVMVTGELEEFWGPSGKPAGAASRGAEENEWR